MHLNKKKGKETIIALYKLFFIVIIPGAATNNALGPTGSAIKYVFIMGCNNLNEWVFVAMCLKDLWVCDSRIQ